MVSPPILFLVMAVPLKHSTSVLSSSGVAVPLSVDKKEVVFVPEPNPVPAVAVSPHVDVPAVLCDRIH